MATYGTGVGEAFRELGDVLELFESDETELDLTFATLPGDNILEDGAVSVEVGVLVPFLDGATEADVTTQDVYFNDDGALLVDLEVTMTQKPDSNATASAGSAESLPSTDAREKNGGGAVTGGDGAATVGSGDEAGGGSVETVGDSAGTDGVSTEIGEEDGETDAPDGTSFVDPDQNRSVGLSVDGKRGDEPTMQNASAEEASSATDEMDEETSPPYKDPERLRSVYEEHDTFGAMTEALDVDVTPQTVRRYMIEYDIHEPASTTGSQSAELLLNTDPESIFEKSTRGDEREGEVSEN